MHQVTKVFQDLQENLDRAALESLGPKVRRAFLGLQVQMDRTGQTALQDLKDQLGLLVFPDLLGERPDRQARRERQERTGQMARMVMMGRRALPVRKAHRDRREVLPQPRRHRLTSSAQRGSRSRRSRFTREPLSTRA